MKNYGAKKATEISKKQIGMIYAKAKSGELKVERWYMSELYDLADYYGYDDNGSAAEHESIVLRILEAAFSGDTEKTQELIDRDTVRVWALLSRKRQQAASRELVA